MIGFVLALVVTMPFLWIHTSKIAPGMSPFTYHILHSMLILVLASLRCQVGRHANRWTWTCHMGNQE